MLCGKDSCPYVLVAAGFAASAWRTLLPLSGDGSRPGTHPPLVTGPPDVLGSAGRVGRQRGRPDGVDGDEIQIHRHGEQPGAVADDCREGEQPEFVDRVS